MNNFCECFFLQLPHDDQILSQSENSNIKHFFEFKGNAQLRASFAH
jgi:hypothetical protein